VRRISASATDRGTTDRGGLTDSVLTALAACPVNGPLHRVLLRDVSDGVALAISTDSTVQTVLFSGRALLLQPGSETLATTTAGVGSYDLTSTVTTSPLASWQSGGTTYNAFAIAWAWRQSTLRCFVPKHQP
jgi:hypothetical protein